MDSDDVHQKLLDALFAAERDLIEWARQHEQPEYSVAPLALFPPVWHIEALRDVVRNAVREALASNGRCPLAGGEAEGAIQFLVGLGERKVGLKHLRDFTSGAERLTVVDPYLFYCEPDAQAVEAAYDDIVDAMRLKGKQLAAVHLVHRRLQRNRRQQPVGDIPLYRKVKKRAEKSGILFSHCVTTDVHDRVWIADGKKAVVVGTSLNGLGGGKASFILPLGDDDRTALVNFLRGRALAD